MFTKADCSIRAISPADACPRCPGSLGDEPCGKEWQWHLICRVPWEKGCCLEMSLVLWGICWKRARFLVAVAKPRWPGYLFTGELAKPLFLFSPFTGVLEASCSFTRDREKESILCWKEKGGWGVFLCAENCEWRRDESEPPGQMCSGGVSRWQPTRSGTELKNTSARVIWD